LFSIDAPVNKLVFLSFIFFRGETGVKHLQFLSRKYYWLSTFGSGKRSGLLTNALAYGQTFWPIDKHSSLFCQNGNDKKMYSVVPWDPIWPRFIYFSYIHVQTFIQAQSFYDTFAKKYGAMTFRQLDMKRMKFCQTIFKK
jgi:hypothetical protein